jgi:hypothetical protein
MNARLTPGHPIDVVSGAENPASREWALRQKSSLMETRIARFYRGDAHDKTERSASILVATLLRR